MLCCWDARYRGAASSLLNRAFEFSNTALSSPSLSLFIDLSVYLLTMYLSACIFKEREREREGETERGERERDRDRERGREREREGGRGSRNKRDKDGDAIAIILRLLSGQRLMKGPAMAGCLLPGPWHSKERAPIGGTGPMPWPTG